jgi:iron(III) transport system substrate-binding protein
LAEGYGIDFYRRLKANGAVQVQAPGDVISGVAEGRFAAGMTLDFLARTAITKGSPLELSTPAPGGIRLYAPVAVFGASKQAAAAEAFANFLLTRPAQEALAAMDRTPVRADVRPPGRGQLEVVPDWPRIFARQAQLQSDYRAVFGG